MPKLRKVILAAGLGTAGFNAYVWNTRQDIRGINIFKPGSADEMLAETLRPGDIILFQRDWQKYYVPKALSVAMYQYLNGSGLDHCGMVLQDSRGELFIFELSSDGYTCSPYRDRIFKSHSDSIVLLPLENSAYISNSVQYREAIFEEVSRVIGEESQPYEPLEVMKGCVAKLVNDNKNRIPVVMSQSVDLDNYPYSPSLRVVIDILQNATGVNFEHKSGSPLHHCTPEDIFRGKLQVTQNASPHTTSTSSLTSLEEPSSTQSESVSVRLGATTVIRDM